MSELEKCSVSEMIGEFIREVAVLVLVFVPLEAYRGVHWKWWVLALAVAGTIIVALLILAIGISIERQRP